VVFSSTLPDNRPMWNLSPRLASRSCMPNCAWADPQLFVCSFIYYIPQVVCGGGGSKILFI